MTSNHDMILLCAEEDEPVIWIDPRGRIGRRGLILARRNEGTGRRSIAPGRAAHGSIPAGPVALRAARDEWHARQLPTFRAPEAWRGYWLYFWT